MSRTVEDCPDVLRPRALGTFDARSPMCLTPKAQRFAACVLALAGFFFGEGASAQETNNSPSFTSSNTESVAENTTAVLTVVATDADTDNRLVRGGATLTIDDLATPVVDVELTPEGHAAMTWADLPVTGGGFSARDSESDYLRGEFYGPAAEEVGGVFERNRLLGAFGAKR